MPETEFPQATDGRIGRSDRHRAPFGKEISKCPQVRPGRRAFNDETEALLRKRSGSHTCLFLHFFERCLKESHSFFRSSETIERCHHGYGVEVSVERRRNIFGQSFNSRPHLAGLAGAPHDILESRVVQFFAADPFADLDNLFELSHHVGNIFWNWLSRWIAQERNIKVVDLPIAILCQMLEPLKVDIATDVVA